VVGEFEPTLRNPLRLTGRALQRLIGPAADARSIERVVR